ncbi:unnamed protein product [Ambrosiozyma monospora]|uniref:Unnamed protein product n=1 Tax=Ambrosiozyma monospora TaxID=43982 RepID=A0ACB5TM18_AMBMO|nr:unnamed protein product [Ambrosiozyma monospora]
MFYELSTFFQIIKDLPTELQTLILALAVKEFSANDWELKVRLGKTRCERLLLFQSVLKWFSPIPLTIEITSSLMRSTIPPTVITISHYHLTENIRVPIKLYVLGYKYIFLDCFLDHLLIKGGTCEIPLMRRFATKLLKDEKPEKDSIDAMSKLPIQSGYSILKNYATHLKVTEKL